MSLNTYDVLNTCLDRSGVSIESPHYMPSGIFSNSSENQTNRSELDYFFEYYTFYVSTIPKFWPLLPFISKS
jgi:hypothetical protein